MSATGARPSQSSIFGEDGKLSSASAATSLKYARAQDLPSYPSTGGVQLSSAGAAASLASSNQKKFEHWKPEAIPAANRAALLAKDAKVDALYTPEASAAGSRAAMMAHANPTQVEAMQPRKPATAKATPAYDVPADSHRKALMAATAASHNRRRSGSLPTQQTQATDETAWALKAAAQSHRNQPSPSPAPFTTGDPGFEAARIQNIAKNNVDRQLFTAAPPVAIEVEEKNRQDTLRASAVAMAQKMYAIQQKHIDEAAAASRSGGQALAASRARSSTMGSSSGTNDGASTAAGYENLEEAARKLAQERLAKIHDEHAEYRKYYGQTSPNRNRLSLRSGRRGSGTATRDDDDSDDEQSRRIRSQMSIFQSKLAEVDSKKRQQDRDNLLEIAHRNVDAQISRMDERVFQDTGKASPAQMEKWQKAAREKAQRDSDERMLNTGKVHIGGGKYLDQSELDAIAKARLQPTLDDINDKAEKQRARDEEERMERERKLEQEKTEKARAAGTAAALKAENDRQKQEAKAAKDEQRRTRKEEEAAQKAQRDEERRVQKEAETAEKERARLEKEEKRKSKDAKPGRFSSLLGRGTGTAGTTPVTSDTADSSAPKKSMELDSETANPTSNPATTDAQVSTSPDPTVKTYHDAVTNETPESTTVPATITQLAASSTGNEQHALDSTEPKVLPKPITEDNQKSLDDKAPDATSPTKSRGRSWIQRLRGKSNPQKDEGQTPAHDQIERPANPESTITRSDSMHNVAMAGRSGTDETADLYGTGREVSPERPTVDHAGRSRNSSVSSISHRHSAEFKPNTDFSLGTTEPAPENAKEDTSVRRKLLKKIRPTKDKSKPDELHTEPTTGTTDDEFEEARDQFDEEKLATPPPLSSVTAENARGRSPKGSRERSRFTEEL